MAAEKLAGLWTRQLALCDLEQEFQMPLKSMNSLRVATVEVRYMQQVKLQYLMNSLFQLVQKRVLSRLEMLDRMIL